MELEHLKPFVIYSHAIITFIIMFCITMRFSKSFIAGLTMAHNPEKCVTVRNHWSIFDKGFKLKYVLLTVCLFILFQFTIHILYYAYRTSYFNYISLLNHHEKYKYYAAKMPEMVLDRINTTQYNTIVLSTKDTLKNLNFILIAYIFCSIFDPFCKRIWILTVLSFASTLISYMLISLFNDNFYSYMHVIEEWYMMFDSDRYVIYVFSQ
jgi:hypothetical protein